MLNFTQSFASDPNYICETLRDSVPSVQFTKHEKHSQRSVTFTKVAAFGGFFLFHIAFTLDLCWWSFCWAKNAFNTSWNHLAAILFWFEARIEMEHCSQTEFFFRLHIYFILYSVCRIDFCCWPIFATRFLFGKLKIIPKPMTFFWFGGVLKDIGHVSFLCCRGNIKCNTTRQDFEHLSHHFRKVIPLVTNFPEMSIFDKPKSVKNCQLWSCNSDIKYFHL